MMQAGNQTKNTLSDVSDDARGINASGFDVKRVL